MKWEGLEAEALGQGLREDILRLTVCSGLCHLDALCPQSRGLGGARELLTGMPPRGLGFLPAWWLVLWGPMSVELAWPCGHSLGRHPPPLAEAVVAPGEVGGPTLRGQGRPHTNLLVCMWKALHLGSDAPGGGEDTDRLGLSDRWAACPTPAPEGSQRAPPPPVRLQQEQLRIWVGMHQGPGAGGAGSLPWRAAAEKAGPGALSTMTGMSACASLGWDG